MNLLFGIIALAAVEMDRSSSGNWCEVGQSVVIPDGREGPVTAVSGELCNVLVYGEKYESKWAYFLIEPSFPNLGR